MTPGKVMDDQNFISWLPSKFDFIGFWKFTKFKFAKFLKNIFSAEQSFRNITEDSVNERQNPLIFNPLTKRINRFWKKISVENEKETDFYFKNDEFSFSA